MDEEGKAKLEELGVRVNAQVNLEGKAFLMRHDPANAGEARVYLYAYVKGTGYVCIRTVRLKRLTVEQMEVLQQLQIEFVKDAPTTY